MDLVQIEGKQPGASDFVEKQIQNYFLINLYWSIVALVFPRGSEVKESAGNEGDADSIPGWGRSPGEG